MITSSVIEAVVSVNRLSSFLRAGELQPDARRIVYKTDRLKEGDEVCDSLSIRFYYMHLNPLIRY